MRRFLFRACACTALPVHRIYSRLLRFAIEHAHEAGRDWPGLRQDGRYVPSYGDILFAEPADRLEAIPYDHVFERISANLAGSGAGGRDRATKDGAHGPPRERTASDTAALAGYDRRLADDPDDHDAAGGKAALLEELGLYEEAIRCYDRRREDPDDTHAVDETIRLLGRLGRCDEAVRLYDEQGAIRHEQKALRLLGHVLERRDVTATSMQQRAALLEKFGRYDEALRCYDESIAESPDDTSAMRDKTRLLGRLGRYEEAIECHDVMIGRDWWDDMSLVEDKISLLVRLGRYDEAARCYDKCLDDLADPGPYMEDVSDVVYAKADLLERLGRYDEAVRCYGEIIRNGFDDNRAYLARAYLLYRTGRTGSLECFDAAAREGKDTHEICDFNPCYEPLQYLKGLFLARIGRYDEAAACYAGCSESRDSIQDVTVLTVWGDMLARIGRHGEALECYDAALGIDAGDELLRYPGGMAGPGPEYDRTEALSRRVSSLHSLGRYDEAVRCCDEIIRYAESGVRRLNGPWDPPGRRQLVFVKVLFLDEIGRHEEAVRCYDAEFDPGAEER